MTHIPAPRLCRLTRSDQETKFGFHLTGTKNKPGQCYISSVEADSPAHYAGLKAGDRILEVEGVSVGLENQGQVVARVAASGSELSLLVADTECEEWHEARDIVITSGLPHVVEIRNGSIGGDIHRTIVTVNCDRNVINDNVSEADQSGNISDNKHELVDLNNNNENAAASGGAEDKTYFQLKIPISCEKSELSSPNPSDNNDPQTNKESEIDNDILVNLTKTAKEMREIIMRRKKKDPRREKRKDIKRRVEMIEEL